MTEAENVLGGRLAQKIRHEEIPGSPRFRVVDLLIADDSRTIRALVHRALTAAGFDVTLACDGKEAVALARRDHPDLVILDIRMPEMDGYTACEKILALSDRCPNLPIIFLTNENAKHLDALGEELGAYLHKPVSDEKLVSTVRALLDRRATSPACSGASE